MGRSTFERRHACGFAIVIKGHTVAAAMLGYLPDYHTHLLSTNASGRNNAAIQPAHHQLHGYSLNFTLTSITHLICPTSILWSK